MQDAQQSSPRPQGSPLAPLRCHASPRTVATRKRGHIHRKLVLDGQYKLRSTLGSGAHGEVKLASTANAEGKKEFVAVKRTPSMNGKEQSPAAVHEARMQAAVHDHPNIATAFDLVSSNKSDVYLVMELGECDLFDFVIKHGPLAPSHCYSLMSQLMSAVAHLHSRHIAHRDIKPENILLTNDATTALLSDFGCAVEFRPGDKPRSDARGTTRCFPPEVFIISPDSGEREVNPMAMDVWGLGVVMFFMLTQRFPFDEADPEEHAAAVVFGRLTHELPADVPVAARILLSRLLQNDPAHRPTAIEALRLLPAST